MVTVSVQIPGEIVMLFMFVLFVLVLVANRIER